MDQKALLIFNPKSGSDPISLEELTERIAMHLNQAELSVFQTTGENDADKIRQDDEKLAQAQSIFMDYILDQR